MLLMCTRSRFGRIAKWSGTIGLVLMLLTCAVSLQKISVWGSGSRNMVVGIGNANAFIGWRAQAPLLSEHPIHYRSMFFSTSTDRPLLHYLWPPRALLQRPFYVRGSTMCHVSVPFWVAALPLSVLTVWLWRRDRRPKPGHCQRCGYDLTGNTSGTCPECGLADGPCN
jgi:hypothetical protein